MKRRGLVFAVSLAACVLAACATPKPPSTFEADFDDDTKAWKEVETQLPPMPQSADLLPFSVSGASSYHFSVDRKALAIGTDGVFRYTLVAVSEQGVRNVSYEGIRCETAERKTYAIGRDDGTWSRARNAAWTRIQEVGNNRQQAALMKEYFCPDGSAQQKLPDVVKRLQRTLPNTIL